MACGHAKRNLALLRRLEAEPGSCWRAWTSRIPSGQLGRRRPPAEEMAHRCHERLLTNLAADTRRE
jgi:hypothetical protein